MKFETAKIWKHFNKPEVCQDIENYPLELIDKISEVYVEYLNLNLNNIIG